MCINNVKDCADVLRFGVWMTFRSSPLEGKEKFVLSYTILPRTKHELKKNRPRKLVDIA